MRNAAAEARYFLPDLIRITSGQKPEYTPILLRFLKKNTDFSPVILSNILLKFQRAKPAHILPDKVLPVF
jgi:hypothetical protein